MSIVFIVLLQGRKLVNYPVSACLSIQEFTLQISFWQIFLDMQPNISQGTSIMIFKKNFVLFTFRRRWKTAVHH